MASPTPSSLSSSPPTLMTLPTEVLYRILSSAITPSSAISASALRTCRIVHSIGSAFLYSSVKLPSDHSTRFALLSIERPDLMAHIQHLTLPLFTPDLHPLRLSTIRFPKLTSLSVRPQASGLEREDFFYAIMGDLAPRTLEWTFHPTSVCFFTDSHLRFSDFSRRVEVLKMDLWHLEELAKFHGDLHPLPKVREVVLTSSFDGTQHPKLLIYSPAQGDKNTLRDGWEAFLGQLQDLRKVVLSFRTGAWRCTSDRRKQVKGFGEMLGDKGVEARVHDPEMEGFLTKELWEMVRDGDWSATRNLESVMKELKE